MAFDLKQFRNSVLLKQNEFAEKVNYKQPILSRMENGDKPVSDRLLMRIEDVFKINLDEHKKYRKNKRGLYLTAKDLHENLENPILEVPHTAEHGDIRGKYRQLLLEKTEIDNKYFALREEHKQTIHELTVVQENNLLLKEIAADMQQVIALLKGHHSEADFLK